MTNIKRRGKFNRRPIAISVLKAPVEVKEVVKQVKKTTKKVNE